MAPWWGKSSSKEAKKSKESFINALQRKLRTADGKTNSRSGGSPRTCNDNDTISEQGTRSPILLRTISPSKQVSRCQSFSSERPQAQPLPLPGVQPPIVGRNDSGISISPKPSSERSSKPSSYLPLPRPACIPRRPNHADLDAELGVGSVSSESSNDSADLLDSRHRSPQATDYDLGSKTAAGSPSSAIVKDQSSIVTPPSSREPRKPANISLSNHIFSTSPKRRPLSSHVPNLQVPYNGNFCIAPDSSMSSPSRSPIRAFSTEQVINNAVSSGKFYMDLTFPGSGHCSSPGSGYNSGHNSMGGDLSGQLFLQQSRGSPEYSPAPSPRMTSPGPSSRVHSGAVTPIHPRAGGIPTESQTWPDEKQTHRLPLPPVAISNAPFSHSNSAATSPSVPRSPGRADNPASPGSRWKKGKLLGRGTFGHVYVGFNSESGEMCAMKEVTLFSDDAKSKESGKQLMQEITLLSRLRHPNIVQYYGSETVEDRLYIYLEYVSGGSIYKLLQEYGQLGEVALRSYTQQILSGLAYLHAKSTVHRDIKGANILVDPTGRVKLADFGMAKHITGQSCPLSLKGSPYWMAPEVIKNSNGCNLAVDIWSLGCTVLEMATTKPPWSQYEGVAAMFKIGNGKELPEIPEHLSHDGKDFVRQCLQRNPAHRPTAAQLLEHPFVKHASPLERPISGSEHSGRNPSFLDSDRSAAPSSRLSTAVFHSSETHIPRNLSCPVSPIGSPLVHSRSPQHPSGRMSPSPISSPRNMSGASTPLTGGSGAIPHQHLKQSPYLQEGFGSLPKPSIGPYSNGPSYQDSNPDIFQGMGIQPGSHIFSEQFGKPAWELYDGQAVLADRVSRQLLSDHITTPSLDLNPNSLSTNRR